MEKINDEVFYKLDKLPIVNQRDAVRLYVNENDNDKVERYIVKQLKKAEQGNNLKKDKAKREIEVAEKLIQQVNPSKYIVKYYQASETEKYYYLMMEKCEGSLDQLFGQNDIINMDPQKRVELMITLFYQIIQGYKYIKSLFPDFIHRDLCLDNIFYKKINNEYIAQIADYGAIKLNYGTLTFDFNKKIDYMPPEAKKDGGTGKYLDNLDVYTLGVCLYRMLFGLTQKVQYFEFHIDRPKESKDDSYCKFLDLVHKMLEYDFTKRLGWKELYQLLYQFPQILSTKGRQDEYVTDCQNYLQGRLEQNYLSKLLDSKMKVIALNFQQLFIGSDQPEQQLMTITVMKYTFQQQFQQFETLTKTEDQFNENISKIRSARYLANLAGQIQFDFSQRNKDFLDLLQNEKQQYQILKKINQPKILKPDFQLFISNKLQQGSCIIF